MADLAGLDQCLHRAEGLFDGHGAIYPVLVVQVNDVDAESGQRRIAGLKNVVGCPVDSDERAILSALIPELGGNHDLIATSFDRLAHQSLVGEGPVHVSGVQEGDTAVERFVNRGDGLFIVTRSVELAHPHAPETFGRDLEPLTQRSMFHNVLHVKLLTTL